MAKEGTIFALKDNKGRYVGSNSISYDKPTNQYVYSYSEFLTNGFYTYTSEMAVTKALEFLQAKAINIKIAIKFHIEKINRNEVLMSESKMDIPRDPFINEYIKGDWAIIA